MSTTDLNKHLFLLIEESLAALGIPGKPQSLYEPFRYALKAGGKRIRPLMTLLASGMCKGEEQDALPAAVAVEILHNFTLVHDDIMDSADTRRGEPSVFKKWNTNVAILSGDVMFAGALQQLSYYGEASSYSKEEYSAMIGTFMKAIVTVCEGQALDMEFVDREEVSLSEYIEMISGKTAALLSGALEMGAIAAHASNEQRKQLAQLGTELGIAFQMQDDLLDAVADPEKFGKRPGGDIFEGKKTYLTILALERANQHQKELIQGTLAAEHPTEESVEAVLQIMKDLNVLDETDQEIKKRYRTSNELISGFPDTGYKKELEKLLIFLENRDH